MQRLFLLDAYALIFRSYYAFINRPMRNRNGMNTSAVFGFTKFLNDIIRNERPDSIGVAFDVHGGSFRNALFPEYKANRPPTPEDIIQSVPYIKRILDAMRIPVLQHEGYEADDVIGTLARKAEAAGMEVYMVTPDKDFGQLVTDRVFIYRNMRGSDGVEIVGPEQIREHYGFSDPVLVRDILALWGDAADNIPGVPGIGEKGAMKLVCRFGPVESILENIDSVTGKQHDSILSVRDQLLLSKRLATIDTAAPVELDMDALRFSEPDLTALRQVYSELDFSMFLRQLPSLEEGAAVPQALPAKAPETAPKAVAQTPQEPDLFSPVPVRSESSARSVRILSDRSEIAAAAELMRRFPQVGFDLIAGSSETGIVGVALSAVDAETVYVPFSQEALGALRPLLEDEAVAKTGYDLKAAVMALSKAGCALKGVLYDVMLIHYILDPESVHSLDALAVSYLGRMPVSQETLTGRARDRIAMERVPAERLAEYSGARAEISAGLYDSLWPEVSSRGMTSLYLDIEEPMIRVLAGIEEAGVAVDCAMLASYGQELRSRMEAIEERIRQEAGEEPVNINSSRQLGALLFERLKLDPKPKRTKTKQYCTDEEYLTFLAPRHPIVPMILEYRGLRKLLSTYVDALPALVSPADGRIHTSFNQAVTATGRLSSTNPNLQNIPVRDALGREIRKAFVPSSEDREILSADYSQVELRLMAHLSGDRNMIEAFQNGGDIHRDTASRLFGVPPGEVTPEQRRRAKTANFGIIYGISAFGLRQRIDSLSMAEAKEIIDGYFRSYPGVREYMDRCVELARDRGYVETIYGRRRYLPDIRSSNAMIRSLAERNAINAPIQGSAADIMKIAMIRVADRLAQARLRSRVILQVHDELVLDMLRCEREQVISIVSESMRGAASLSVPLEVECGVGASWLEAH